MLSKEPNFHIVLTARNKDLGLSAIKKLNEEGINNVDFLHLDLNDQQSIDNAAKELKNKYSGIDILINNAGNSLFVDFS